jgi:Pyruvate/2-oxoacid:ferredoxin oxidoreductase delta subunit
MHQTSFVKKCKTKKAKTKYQKGQDKTAKTEKAKTKQQKQKRPKQKIKTKMSCPLCKKFCRAALFYCAKIVPDVR